MASCAPCFAERSDYSFALSIQASRVRCAEFFGRVGYKTKSSAALPLLLSNDGRGAQSAGGFSRDVARGGGTCGQRRSTARSFLAFSRGARSLPGGQRTGFTGGRCRS